MFNILSSRGKLDPWPHSKFEASYMKPWLKKADNPSHLQPNQPKRITSGFQVITVSTAIIKKTNKQKQTSTVYWWECGRKGNSQALLLSVS